MVKSPNRVSPSPDSHTTYKIIRYVLALGIIAAFVTTLVLSAMAGSAMNDVLEEGSNPRNTSDTSLTDPEKALQIFSSGAMTAFFFTALLTLIYIAAKL